jgi:RHS repeat-associated protein
VSAVLRVDDGFLGDAPVASQTFAYDPFGNISKNGSPYSFQPTSYSNNRIVSLPGCTPTYDANGNLTNDCIHTYAWDANGRPTTIDGINLTYDAFGRMVEQNRSGVYTQIVYAPTGQKFALMNGQTLHEAFAPLPGGGLAAYNSSGLLYYGHSDHLGSVRFASTPSRTMYYDGAYAPFGEPYAQSGTADLSFTGQRQDTVSGLYDFPAREYSITGRWVSPDPAGLAAVDPTNPQSWNRYAYVLNNPLALVDPLGLCPAGGRRVPCKGAFWPNPFRIINAFDLIFSTGCGESGCATFLDPNGFNYFLLLLNNNDGFGSSALKKLIQAACKAINPADVHTAGVGADFGTGIGGGEGFQLGIAANGNSGQVGFTFTYNVDLGFIGPDAYVYSGSVPNASDNSKLTGNSFFAAGNISNHVNVGYGRIGASYGLDDNSKTFTFGPSMFPFTLTFGTSRTAVFANIPYVGYALNPARAVCKAVGK